MTEESHGCAILNQNASLAEGKFTLKATREVMVWLAGSALLIVLGVTASLWIFRQIEESSAVRQHTSDILNSMGSLQSALKDAETSQRGYLLTGEEVFLEPYLRVRESIRNNLANLRQLTLDGAAQQHLDALAPLVDAKLKYLANNIESGRKHDMAAALANMRGGQGRQLMDEINAEINAYNMREKNILAQRETEFQSSMRQMFSIIVVTSLFALLFALAFARLMRRESRQRLKALVDSETRHLLLAQEETNRQLQEANVTLRNSEERLAVTINSIGDAVIATDANGLMTLMNPLAERLTGWSQTEAYGRPVDEIFQIISQETRQPARLPVAETLAHGTVHGLANHTILIARDGSECDISDSCAPILDRDHHVIGAVLVFRDVTGQYAAQHALDTQRAELETQNEELLTTQEVLRITQARYFDLYDRAPVGYITVNEQGVIQEGNSTAAKLLGMAPVRQIFYSFIFAADQDIYYLCRKRLMASDEPQDCELRMLKCDGSQIWVQLSIAAAQDEGEPILRIAMVDIDKRKLFEMEQKIFDQRLRDQQFYTRSLIESNIDALMTTDSSGIISDVNKQMEHLTGCTRDELIGAPFKKFFTDPELAETGIKRVLRERKVSNYELTAFNRDGRETAVSYNAATFYNRDGKLQGVFAAARDVTERKFLEKLLLENNAELKRSTLVAEKASLAKSIFLSSMSHELRTPLNAILGFAQLLEAGTTPLTDTQNARLQQITKAGWYLLELINEILDLAVIESGKLALSREAVSLMDVMHECQGMIESQAQKHGIRMDFLPFDPAWYVNADRTRVKQALINLLSNAIKYNREQGTVAVKCTCTPDRIRISIRDSGAGLSAENLLQLFQPFNRLGQENSSEEGTGIGLVVTKQLVELMGGTIQVESTVGVGSEFVIELIRDEMPQLDTKLPAGLAPQAHKDAALRTLLYVEDNPANLMLVEQIIDGLPHMHMLSAKDGSLGVALARSHLPDVILMDINLPGIDGIQAMEILRKDPATAHIPVIALSANAMLRDIEKGLEAGFFRYLTKPIKIVEFMKALKEAFKSSEIQSVNLTEK